MLWFDKPEMRYVRAKIRLAGHLDQQLRCRYFQPWLWMQIPCSSLSKQVSMKFFNFITDIIFRGRIDVCQSKGEQSQGVIKKQKQIFDWKSHQIIGWLEEKHWHTQDIIHLNQYKARVSIQTEVSVTALHHKWFKRELYCHLQELFFSFIP